MLEINLSCKDETVDGKVSFNGTVVVEVISNVVFINPTNKVTGHELVQALADMTAELTKIAGEVGNASV